MKSLAKILILCVFSITLASCGEKAPPPQPDPLPTADDTEAPK